MKYKFETIKKDYGDFSSGRVLYNAAHTTAFPVRLASEIIQRAFHILRKNGANGPYKIYDIMIQRLIQFNYPLKCSA